MSRFHFSSLMGQSRTALPHDSLINFDWSYSNKARHTCVHLCRCQRRPPPAALSKIRRPVRWRTIWYSVALPLHRIGVCWPTQRLWHKICKAPDLPKAIASVGGATQQKPWPPVRTFSQRLKSNRLPRSIQLAGECARKRHTHTHTRDQTLMTSSGKTFHRIGLSAAHSLFAASWY